jgi:hypothetical protein
VTAGTLSRQDIGKAIAELEGWLERHDWRGYEPHDGLRTPLRRLLGQNRTALLVLKQFVLRSPWNVRPWLGIPRETSPESLGFFAKGYLRLLSATGDLRYRERAVAMLDRMIAAAEPGFAGLCWANQFDYVTRFFYLPARTPIIVWTAHNAHALLDAYEQLGTPAYRDAAISAARFIVEDLPRHVEGDTVCLSYVPIGDHPVHNANVLGASVLARVGALTGDRSLIDLAQRAMAYTVAHQQADGSWWYGEAPNLRWVDNFHTGYVLESLAIYRTATADSSFDDAIHLGFQFFGDRFFESNGAPRYFADRLFPIDVQCAAQAIETLLVFKHEDGATAKARQVAAWAIAHLRDRTGYFYFRKHARVINKSPLLHWGQATMFSALAGLLEESSGH